MSVKVSVAGGKYAVLLPETAEERLCALRHDEAWRDCVGDNLIYWLAVELQELRDNQAKDKLDAFKAGAEWAAQFCEDQTFATGGKRDVNEVSYWCRLVSAEEVEKAYREGYNDFGDVFTDWSNSRAKLITEGKA